MIEMYKNLDLNTESDVEQKFIYKLLTSDEPNGLAYLDSDIKTKFNIKKLKIGKGNGQKLYYPDYMIFLDGFPMVIIEAKAPGEDIDEALREARLYATEANALYDVNPCERIIVTNGNTLIASFWDNADPYIKVEAEDFYSFHPDFSKFISFVSKKTTAKRVNEIRRMIKSKAKYNKPVFMLGSHSVMNEMVGENDFGASISIEYKYLFNPNTDEDREAIVQNAYVKSKRKQSHADRIDRLIRATIPSHAINARLIDDTKNPVLIFEELADVKKVLNEICILIGSVGSGKSTFVDYLRMEALPKSVQERTEWIRLDLNNAPLSREKIYKWIVVESIDSIKRKHENIDFYEIDIIGRIYKKELDKVKKGKAALFEKDSPRYNEVLFEEISRLESDPENTLNGMIDMLYTIKSKILVIVLDNCDKRNRDDQLLMFEVASWLKSRFQCMIFLPLRDITYDQFRNEPPLDTVIKDLVFRIDPPMLDKVIYSRLNYAIREIEGQASKFYYHSPNNIRIECSREEVKKYLRAIISSLFQNRLFRRIIIGLAGRNIRKGLEIILDFCKSGHIGSDEILKIRHSNGNYLLSNHLIAKILMKGERKYYRDTDSHIKNLFNSCADDALPDPFVRVSMLGWLKDRRGEHGPNHIKGFHKVANLVDALQSSGHSYDRVLLELSELIEGGCVASESQMHDVDLESLVIITPSGFIHLELLTNISYLSAVAEDVLFREHEVAKKIANNLVGANGFRVDSHQMAISNSKMLVEYLYSYYQNYFIGSERILEGENFEKYLDLTRVYDYVARVVANDKYFSEADESEKKYPPGTFELAQIVAIKEYGFFVSFGVSGSGLVHKSEFNGVEVADECEEGCWVIVEIIKFNIQHKRFELRLIEID